MLSAIDMDNPSKLFTFINDNGKDAYFNYDLATLLSPPTVASNQYHYDYYTTGCYITDLYINTPFTVCEINHIGT